MIEEIITGFDAEAFCKFLRSKFASFSESLVKIPTINDFQLDGAAQLGIVKTLAGPNGSNLPLIVVAAKLADGEKLKERCSRLKQFKFAKQVLDQAMANRAPGVEGVITQGLFVFHDDAGNFRLSLVFGKAEGDKLGWSTKKRLSFHVEAGAGNKTFRDRMSLPWSSFDKLKEAFSVEKLTKEFYSRLFDWYQLALASDEVVFPNDIVKDKDSGEVKSEQIIRLITRLMFVWFLKQKHLVPDDLFAPEKLVGVLKQFDPDRGENYYRVILQNLFFATLNSEIKEREFVVEGSRKENEEHFGVKVLYRYASEFPMPEKEAIKLFEKIPFLNGGLFECLDRDNHYYDGFSRRKSKQARIPNRLFFNEKDGLIPLLRLYNFTVEENSPGDEEVALDPELLGKVFENLLGAYNPETKVLARNATGSFYTPREIVNYMVDESLIAHLVGKCGEDHAETIRKLFADGERPTDRKLCGKMDAALVSAKILDPACGSGAFPMGVLLRMVVLLRILRNLPEDQSVYDLKLELIGNCIYGGDIQCIAVQISKLRFFISLVCEQKRTDDPRKNFGIDTLPNLETKFVAADSLIGLPEAGRDVLDLCTGDIADLKEKLFDVRRRHFGARNYQQKKDLRKEDEKLRSQIKQTVQRDAKPDRKHLELLLKEREKVVEPKWISKGPKAVMKEMFAEYGSSSKPEQTLLDANKEQRKRLDAEIAREQKKVNLPTTVVDGIAEMLAAWDPYDQNASAHFSDPEWMFNVKDGFDIVIGNPPYVNLANIRPDAMREKLKSIYFSARNKADLYAFFIERGFLLLNTRGIMAYIIPHTWKATDSFRNLREIIFRDHSLLKIVNMKLGVFDAIVQPLIAFFSAACVNLDIDVLDDSFTRLDVISRDEILKNLHLELDTTSSRAMRCLYEKIEKDSIRLESIIKFSRGIKTSDDSRFVSTTRKNNNSFEVYRGRNIKAYSLDWGGEYIWYRPDLMREKVGCVPYTKEMFVVPEKLITQRVNSSFQLLVTYDDKQRFYLDTVNVSRIETWDNKVSLKYLCGILNSRLMTFWYCNKYRMPTIGLYELHSIPIKVMKDQNDIVILVDRILAAKQDDPTTDTSALEDEINELVFDLYGLSPDEKEIVKKSVTRGGIPAREADGEDSDADAAPEPKKKPMKKRKTALPPSLPGWD